MSWIIAISFLILFYIVFKKVVDFIFSQKKEGVSGKSEKEDLGIKMPKVGRTRTITKTTAIMIEFLIIIVLCFVAFNIFIFVYEYVIYTFFDKKRSVDGLLFLAGIIATAYFCYYSIKKAKKIIIPTNHVGIMTFFGERKNVILREGEYRKWLWDNFILGIYRGELFIASGSKGHVGMSRGLPYIDEDTHPVWDAVGGNKSVITRPAQNGMDVSIKMSLKLRIFNPYLFSTKGDVFLSIFEDVRSFIQDIFTELNDIDLYKIQRLIVKLLDGESLIATVTTIGNPLSAISKFDIVRYSNGNLAIDVLGKEAVTADVEKMLLEKVKREAHDNFLHLPGGSNNFKTKIITPPIDLREKAVAVGVEIVEIKVTSVSLTPERQKDLHSLEEEAQEVAKEKMTAESYVSIVKSLIAEGHDPRVAEIVASKMVGKSAGNTIYLNTNNGGNKNSNNEFTEALIVAEEYKKNNNED